jgi:hypothetical protein
MTNASFRCANVLRDTHDPRNVTPVTHHQDTPTPDSTPANPKGRIVLKRDEDGVLLFTGLAKRHGWESLQDIADALGMSPRQVRRVLDGSDDPGVAFIAGLLLAAPETGFRRIFEPVKEVK